MTLKPHGSRAPLVASLISSGVALAAGSILACRVRRVFFCTALPPRSEPSCMVIQTWYSHPGLPVSSGTYLIMEVAPAWCWSQRMAWMMEMGASRRKAFLWWIQEVETREEASAGVSSESVVPDARTNLRT